MKTKIVCIIIAFAAINAMKAQNSSYNLDLVPVPGSGTDNSAFGVNVLNSNTGGFGNTGLGSNVFFSNTTGAANTAVGSFAMFSNTSGTENTAIGINALYANTTGFNNTAGGELTLAGNTTGGENTAYGHEAMTQNSTGNGNTGMGIFALDGNQTGDNNTAVGGLALGWNTTGSNNSGFGWQATTMVGSVLNNATAIGANAIVNANDKVRIGDVNVTVIEGQPAVYTGSDGRFKSNIKEEDVVGLDFIKKLRPVVYNFETKKFEEFLTKNMPENVKQARLGRDFSKSTALRRSGFIAQEVEQAAKDANYNFDAIHKPADDNDNYSLAYSQFVVPLVKGMQEQQQMIEQQQQAINSLQQQLSDLQNKQQVSTGIKNETATGFFMDQNEPNPFSGETVIKYSLPANTAKASLVVYDLSGKQLNSFNVEPTAQAITITSQNLAAGIYIYTIVADGKALDTKRMIVAGK